MESKEREVHGQWYTEERLTKSDEFSPSFGLKTHKFLITYGVTTIFAESSTSKGVDQGHYQLLQAIPTNAGEVGPFLTLFEILEAKPDTPYPQIL